MEQIIKKVSFKLENGYVSIWSEKEGRFDYTVDLPIMPDDEKGEKALKHFNDNYFDYKFVGGALVYDSNNHGAMKLQAAQQDAANKVIRGRYMDAYRKYQAAVNYGEFTKKPVVDVFIDALKAKNWAALNNVPPQLRYFTGEAGFAESGLDAN